MGRLYARCPLRCLGGVFYSKQGSAKDPFWENASRAIFKTTLRKFAFQEKTNIEELTTFLLRASDRDFAEFFEGTEAATFAFINNDRTIQSIRSVLSSQIEGLHHLETSQTSFSIRDWVEVEDHIGWCFITARADQRQTGFFCLAFYSFDEIGSEGAELIQFYKTLLTK